LVVAIALDTALRVPAAQAQEVKRTPIVALLNPAPPVPRFTQTIHSTLRDLGYEPGRNITYLERWAGGSEEQLQQYAAELARLRVDVIAVGTSAGVRAAARATKTIPIVAVDMESDPVANGWASSMAKPGGNITGFFLDQPQLSGKRLEQLKEVVPKLTTVAILWDTLLDRSALKATEISARTLGMRVIVLEVQRHDEIAQAIEAASKRRVQAILMMQSPMLEVNASRIATLATERRIPVAGIFAFLAESGFLLTYGPNVDELVVRCWKYVDRILKGEKPGDLPVQRPEKFDLVLNLKVAETLGIRFPQTLLLQADQVIR
jgi:putative ABC transport system substrate-binding protein